jgi:sugar lactone lactonase YvrE
MKRSALAVVLAVLASTLTSPVTALTGVLGAGSASAEELRQVATFDPSLGELPESIATDARGSFFLTMGNTVRELTADGVLTVLATLPLPAGASTAGVALDGDGDLFVVSGAFAPDPLAPRLWKIARSGAFEVVATFPPESFPNDLVLDDAGSIFVTDSFLGRVWKVDCAGQLTVWLSSPALLGNPAAPVLPVHALGANGIAFDAAKRNLFIGNLDAGQIFRVAIGHHGLPGPLEVFAADARLQGADGIAFDRRGTLYVGVDIRDRIATIDRHGRVEVVAEGGLLDGPSSLVFGTTRRTRKTLFISNFAIGRALGIVPGVPHPGVVALPVPEPGLPLP